MTVSAVFGYGIEKVVTEPLFQYDIGQKLNISGLEVDETTEIHFKSPYSKIAKIATGTLEGSTMTVDIPDEFLENSGNGLVWVCLTDENAVTTIRTISIPIKERAKPDGYVSKGDGTYKKFDEEIAKLNAGFQNCEKKLNIGAVTSASSLISYKEKGTIYTGTIAYQADYSGDFLMFIINSGRYLMTSDGHLWRFNSLTATTPTKLTYTAAEVESLLDDYDEAVIAKLNLKADKATTLAGYGITDGENSGNKVSAKSEITDEDANYPSIKYLNDYYYDYNEVDEALSGKLDNASGAVKTDNIANKAVTSDKLASSAVTSMKIANNAVAGNHIAQNQIGTAHLMNGIITTEKLADKSVTISKLSDDLLNYIKTSSGAGGGKSAYDIALEHGFIGSEDKWLASLKGSDYVLTDADKTEIANIVINEYDSSIMAILGGDNGVTE